MRQTISQQRSLSGRMKMGEAAIAVFKERPIFGVGANNFSHAANGLLFEDDDVAYTSFSGSIAIQILAEQGMVGIVIITSCLCSFFLLFKKRKTLSSLIILCFFLIVIKELSFPSLFTFPASTLLLFVLLAVSVNLFHEKSVAMPLKNRSLLSFSAIVLLIAAFAIRYSRNEKLNSRCIDEVHKGHLYEAVSQIEKTSLSVPYLINRSILYWAVFQEYSDGNAMEKSKEYLLKALEKSPESPPLLYNLASIENAQGNVEASQQIMNGLSVNYPNKSLFWLTSFVYKSDSLSYLLKAIEINPNILETDCFKNIQQNAPNIKDEVRDYFLRNIETEISCPIQNAKHGKLLFLLEDYANAKPYLERSLALLPNLSAPYAALGIIAQNEGRHKRAESYLKKYELLSKYSALSSENSLLKNNYNLKFQSYYNSRTLNRGTIYPFSIEEALQNFHD